MDPQKLSKAHWSDEPLDPKISDSLGRDGFVSTIISRISLAQVTDPSTVFGIVGEWGSGKSSILSRVRAGLGNDWLVGEFTPWSSGDAGAMSIEFVSTLAEVIGEKDSSEVAAQLARYAAFAAPLLSVVPFAGTAAKGVAEKVIDTFGQRPPWHTQFQKLSDTVEAVGKKVLILVDDVDRLGSHELLTLLRIVRLLGRFRGVHYLLAYDQDTVEDLLRSTGSVGRSAAFMEKIVQYPFETPPMPRAAVGRLLNEVLKELVDVTGHQLDEVGVMRSAELVSIFSSQIRTPRTLGRLREHLLAFASHVVSAELDLLDYVAVTWLRLNSHGVWGQLSHWHHDLRTGERSTGFLKTQKMSEEEWVTRISGASGNEDPNGTIAVLSFLFPGATFRGNGHYYEHPRGLANPRYLGRYLLLDIPEDDVSDDLVGRAILDLLTKRLSDHVNELADIIDKGDDALSELAIGKMTERRRQASITSTELLSFLIDRLQARSTDGEQLGSPHRAMRILLAREIACAVLSGSSTAESIIEMVGEKESLSLVWLAPRSPEFRSRADEILKGFGQYWRTQLIERYGELCETKQIGFIAELIVHVYDPEDVGGLLDEKVSDFDGYVSLATSFSRFSEWVGSDVHYELTFREKAFKTLISRNMRQRFEEAIESEVGKVKYETDDLPSAHVDDHILRAFAIDSIHQISSSDQH